MLDMQSIICVNPFPLQYLWMKQNWGAGAKQIHHDLLLKKALNRKFRNFPCPQKQSCLYENRVETTLTTVISRL